MSLVWPVVGFAFDHRDSLREAATRKCVPADRSGLAAFKSRAVRALAPSATLVLLDHELGADALRHVPWDAARIARAVSPAGPLPR